MFLSSPFLFRFILVFPAFCLESNYLVNSPSLKSTQVDLKVKITEFLTHGDFDRHFLSFSKDSSDAGGLVLPVFCYVCNWCLLLRSLGRSKVCLFAFTLVLDFLPLIPEHFLSCPKLATGKHELHWLIWLQVQGSLQMLYVASLVWTWKFLDSNIGSGNMKGVGLGMFFCCRRRMRSWKGMQHWTNCSGRFTVMLMRIPGEPWINLL